VSVKTSSFRPPCIWQAYKPSKYSRSNRQYNVFDTIASGNGLYTMCGFMLLRLSVGLFSVYL